MVPLQLSPTSDEPPSDPYHRRVPDGSLPVPPSPGCRPTPTVPSSEPTVPGCGPTVPGCGPVAPSCLRPPYASRDPSQASRRMLGSYPIPASCRSPPLATASAVSSSPVSPFPRSASRLALPPAACASLSSLQDEVVPEAPGHRTLGGAERPRDEAAREPCGGPVSRCPMEKRRETPAETAHAVLVNDSWTSSTAPLCAACQVLRGALAGSCAKTVVYPLDRLKMHLQVKAAATGQAFQLSGAVSVLKNMASSEQGGVRALWRGNGSAFIRAFPYSGFSFYSFERYNLYLRSQAPSWPKLCQLGAGSAAGMTATLLTYPLDVLNTRMAVTAHRLSYAEVSLWKFEGFRSLFRGISATALGIVPYAGISFCAFETLKDECRAQGMQITPVVNALCGGLAGVAGQTATYPLDTVRKFMQSSSFLYRFHETGHTGSASPPSLIEAFKFLYRRSGWRGLYNGVSLNWIKGFLAAGLAFSLNESGKQHLTPIFCQHPPRPL
ncbi:mitochondrial carrier superfamily protein [Toxoplasma gondii RUB]|uniref:Mitochondrial carrier superfamily protein n=1 Tax=Toxoplasma gondii RUB TaxID=935652 RepID=A0A086M575_TOXGO|nr:mitochondrial carrier superfamily protein [Toxoplasma gondii RUB]